jgi:septum site-determining protein MinC
MKYVNGPIRSGQTIQAAGGDLTIIGSVSRGAQVFADGSIHVLGPLLGRAMAGNDDAEARIIATHFDPELVAIAGLYVNSDQIPPECLQRPTQVLIQGGHFRIRPLGPA